MDSYGGKALAEKSRARRARLLQFPHSLKSHAPVWQTEHRIPAPRTDAPITAHGSAAARQRGIYLPW